MEIKGVGVPLGNRIGCLPREISDTVAYGMLEHLQE